MEPPNSFGEWLRRRRRALDWTQDELAKRTGCAVGTIRKIESDELRPSKQLAEILAQRLDIPPRDREDFVRFARGVLRDVSPTLPFVEETASLATTHRDTKPIHNLPIQLTSFIGREREMAQLKQLVQTARLVTLTGAGGCGKTRLALQTATNLLSDFKDGVWLVELAPLADPTLVPQTVAAVFGLRQEEARSISETVIDFLREKNLLLFLDNCEHLIDACAKFADSLLHACPKLKILASSREALGVAGEMPYRVPSLSLPPKDSDLETLTKSEAARLFIDRAVTLEPAFTLTPHNAPVIVQICQRLDGIPLALELAAARIKVLSVEQIAKRLDDRFKLLTGGSRTALPRQQTLRALIDWSYDLLLEAERILLRRLSVFAGGWTLEAAQAVCSCAPVCADDVLDLLARLVDKSLVRVEPQGDTTRYRMTETIRQYARDKLLESGEGEQIRMRHLDFFLRLAEAAESKLRGPEQCDWLDRLEIEHDNLRGALEWSTNEGCVERGMRLATALLWFWALRGHWSEGRESAENLLMQPEAFPRTLTCANTLFTTAFLLGQLGEWKMEQKYLEESINVAREHGAAGEKTLALGLALLAQRIIGNDPSAAENMMAQSLTIAESNGDKWSLAFVLFEAGILSSAKKDLTAARENFEASQKLFQSVGDRQWSVRSAYYVSRGKLGNGDFEAARLAIQQILPFFHETKDKQGYRIALNALGEVARVQGNYELARGYYSESLGIARELGSKEGISVVTGNLGFVLVREHKLEEAKALFREALTVGQEIDNRGSVSGALQGYASIAAAQEHSLLAVRIFAAARSLLDQTIDQRSLNPIDEAEFERNLAIAREQVDEATFNAAWAEGQKMTMEQAIEYALAE